MASPELVNHFWPSGLNNFYINHGKNAFLEMQMTINFGFGTSPQGIMYMCVYFHALIRKNDDFCMYRCFPIMKKQNNR